MFVMWLGEQISLFGIGNGTSMIIFAGIVARFPDEFKQLALYKKDIWTCCRSAFIIAIASRRLFFLC
jgi:preprotein translocase subunit SecY